MDNIAVERLDGLIRADRDKTDTNGRRVIRSCVSN